MKQARLCPVIRFHLQRILVLPGDVQVRRQPHDTGRAVRLARVSFGLVLCRIPFHRFLSGRGFVRDVALRRGVRTGADEPDARILDRAGDAAAEIAFRRHEHADVPVLGDHRGPVAGEVDRSDRLRRRWRSCLASASLRLQQCRCEDADDKPRRHGEHGEKIVSVPSCLRGS